MPFSVFVTRRLTPDAEDKLNAFCQAEYWPEETPPPYPVLLEKTRDIDGLLCLLTDSIDADLINQAAQLKVISQVAVGVDNIGMGRIGQAVARRAQGFAMPILYVDNSDHPALENELDAKRVPLTQLLEKADIVSLHVPLNETTARLIGAEQFELMKTHAILVNAARGAVVDTDALVTALKTGQIGYAALDVTDPEPLPHTHELYQLPNALIVPHIGSATRAARNQMALLAVDNLVAGLQGDPLPKAVYQP